MSTLRELVVSIDFDDIDLRKITKMDDIMDDVENSLVKVGKGIDHMAADMRSASRQADDLGKGLQDVGRNADRMGDNLRGAGNRGSSGFDSLVSGARGLAATVAGLWVVEEAITGIRDALETGIKTNADMETALISWEAILKSADKAKDTVAEIQQLAADTPFETDSLDKSARLLTLANLGGENLVKTLTSLGDAVSISGGTGETLEGVSMAFFQMFAKGKVQAEEMMQLAERGLDPWGALSKQMHKTTAELMEMASNGDLLAKDVLPLLVKGLGSQFAGGMEKQSKTFNGMASTMADNFKLLMGVVSKPLFDKLEAGMPKVLEFMNVVSEQTKYFGAHGFLSAFFGKEGADGIMEVFGWLKGAFDGWFAEINTILNANGGKIKNAFNAIFDSVKSVVGFITVLWDNWGDDITSVTSTSWGLVADIVSTVFRFIADTVNLVTDLMRGDWSSAMTDIKTLFSNALGGLLTVGTSLLDLLNQVFNLKIGNIVNTLKSIDLMQTGRDIINGLIKGMTSMFDSAVKEIEEFGQSIETTLTDFFDIHSPSRVMAWIGKQLTAGVEVGISENAQGAINQARSLSQEVADAGNVVDMARYRDARQQAQQPTTTAPQVTASSAPAGNSLSFNPVINIQISGDANNQNVAQTAADAARRELQRFWEDMQVKMA